MAASRHVIRCLRRAPNRRTQKPPSRGKVVPYRSVSTPEIVPARPPLAAQHPRTGATRPLTLFSDGSFYETRLQPGEYEVIEAFDGAGGMQESGARISIAPVADPEDGSPPLMANLIVRLTATEAEAATAYQR